MLTYNGLLTRIMTNVVGEGEVDVSAAEEKEMENEAYAQGLCVSYSFALLK